MEQQSNLSVRQRYAQEGRCIRCGDQRDTLAKSCKRCREFGRADSARHRVKATQEGRCKDCGQPRDGSTQRCGRCRDKGRTKMVATRQHRAAIDLCPRCGIRPPRLGKKSCQECAEASAQYARKSQIDLRQQMVAAYGGRCVCCREDDWRFLTIDHVEGDGGQDRKKGGFYRSLKRRGWPQEGLQLLCANCNSAKWWFDECPHNDSSLSRCSP